MFDLIVILLIGCGFVIAVGLFCIFLLFIAVLVTESTVKSAFSDSFDESFKRSLRDQYGYTAEETEETLRDYLSKYKRA